MLRGATWLPVERDADPNRVRRHYSAARSAVPTNTVAEALQQARNALLREMHNVYKYMQREHDVQPDDVMATIMVGALTLSMREQEVQAASQSMLTRYISHMSPKHRRIGSCGRSSLDSGCSHRLLLTDT